MRPAVLGLALLCSSCVTERSVELAIEPPRDAMGGPDVPADVVSWEIRVSRIGDDDACPSVEVSASSSRFGELATAQAFRVDGASTAIGELPSGRWAFAALARDAGCAPRLYGCVIQRLEGELASVTIPVAAIDTPATCGCRTCASGECTQVAQVCP